MHLSVQLLCQQYSRTNGPSLPLSHSLCSFTHFMTAHHSQCCCFVATPIPDAFYVPIKTILLVELPQEMHHWQFQPQVSKTLLHNSRCHAQLKLQLDTSLLNTTNPSATNGRVFSMQKSNNISFLFSSSTFCDGRLIQLS